MKKLDFYFILFFLKCLIALDELNKVLVTDVDLPQKSKFLSFQTTV